jgi:hypothetical protein
VAFAVKEVELPVSAKTVRYSVTLMLAGTSVSSWHELHTSKYLRKERNSDEYC